MSTLYRHGPYVGLTSQTLPADMAYVWSPAIDIANAVQVIAQVDFTQAGGSGSVDMQVQVQDVARGTWRWLTKTRDDSLNVAGYVRLATGPVIYELPEESGSYIVPVSVMGLITRVRFGFAMAKSHDTPGTLAFSYLVQMASSLD